MVEIRNLVGGSATVCSSRLSIPAAAKLMVDERIGSLAIMDGGVMSGILTDRDVLRAVASKSDCESLIVEDWMTPDPDSLTPDVDVADAAEWLMATGYRHLPVLEDGQLLGIVSIKDVLWALKSPEA